MNFEQFYNERKYSLITEEFPDKQKFPLYYTAQRKEFVIGEGQMLFIPAGWWHFAFSEEPNHISGINFAINYWYEEPNNFQEDQPTILPPRIEQHGLPNLDPSDILQDYDLTLHRSKRKYFPPDILKHRFQDLTLEHMTYKEFLITKNPQYYILQNKCSALNKYAPQFERPLFQSSIWINFGHVYSLPHYDMKDNWLCQMKGKKRVILFAPEERDKLYPINPYPVSLLRSLEEKMVGDSFIRRNSFSIELKLCEHFLRLLPEKTVDHEALTESHQKEAKALENYFRSQSCASPNFPNPKTFNLIDVRKSFYEKTQFDIPCIFIWFVTNARLNIRNFTFDVLPGQLFIFPSNYIYPWKVENGVFILPKFHRK
jgi:Cupin-like domain